jgi:anthranilate phosphoribosyltransferase
VSSVEESKEMLLTALADREGAPRDIVALNAGASIYTAGLAKTLAEGVDKARATLASGAARRKVDEFVACTRDV